MTEIGQITQCVESKIVNVSAFLRRIYYHKEEYSESPLSNESNVFREHVPLGDSSYVQIDVFVLRILF